MYCYNCGNELSDKAVVCPNCKTNKSENSISPIISMIPIIGIIVGLIHIKTKNGRNTLLLAVILSILYSFLCIGLINFLQENIIEIINFNL